MNLWFIVSQSEEVQVTSRACNWHRKWGWEVGVGVVVSLVRLSPPPVEPDVISRQILSELS